MTHIYKIVSRQSWQDAEKAGVFKGAAIDITDGYIHLSSELQVEETARRHFAGQDDLLLVAFDANRFGSALKWEASRGGDLFPHLYAALSTADALWAKPLPWNGTSHDFPEGWRG